MKEYYYLDAQKKPCGPHTADELRALLTLGNLSPGTLIAHKGADKWVPLSTLTAPATPAPATLNIPTVPSPAAGNCPNCGEQIMLTYEGFPSRCPHCSFRLCADNASSLWSNFKLAFSKMFVLRGRAPRIEYWSYYLFSMIFNYAAYFLLSTFMVIIGAAVDADVCDPMIGIVAMVLLVILYSLFNIVLSIPQLTAAVRRLHDVGKSGWLILVPFILSMLLTAIILIAIENRFDFDDNNLAMICGASFICLAMLGTGIYFFVLTLLDSQRGPNKYGPSSKYPLG